MNHAPLFTEIGLLFVNVVNVVLSGEIEGSELSRPWNMEVYIHVQALRLRTGKDASSTSSHNATVGVREGLAGHEPESPPPQLPTGEDLNIDGLALTSDSTLLSTSVSLTLKSQGVLCSTAFSALF